jgi:hypothetical protein
MTREEAREAEFRDTWTVSRLLFLANIIYAAAGVVGCGLCTAILTHVVK